LFESICSGLPSTPRRISSQKATVLVLAALLASSSVSLAQAPLPATGTPLGALPSLGDNSELAAAAERRLGDRIATSIYRDPDLVEDPVLNDYIDGIWQSLRAAARARGELSPELDERFAWDVFLVRDRSVNAFALPGGYFGVHLGLIGTVSSVDELAAVLAHELSHVTQRHISRLMTQQKQQAPWVLAAMILGAMAAGKNSNVGNAAIVGGQTLAMQGQLNFSRDMEREADRVGFSVMQGAGYEIRGMASMFEKLQQASRLNDSGGFPYLRSHPLTTERIAEAQSRMQIGAKEPFKLGAAGTATSAISPVLHAMMAARARILAAPGVDGLRPMVADAERRAAALQTSAPTAASAVRDAGILYAGSYAAAHLRDFGVARSLLARLKPLAAGNDHAADAVNLLSIDIDLLSGIVPASAALFDMSSATTRADVLTQSRSLLAARRAAEVSSRLQSWVTAHPKDATAWQLLATAYGNQGQNVRAIRADAESRAAQLDYGAALDRMKAAQTMIRSTPASADHVESSIIDTRTRQLESVVKEKALQDKIDGKL
jgi:predicted Zn-dependent protease